MGMEHCSDGWRVFQMVGYSVHCWAETTVDLWVAPMVECWVVMMAA